MKLCCIVQVIHVTRFQLLGFSLATFSIPASNIQDF